MIYDLNGYRLIKSHRTETRLSARLAFRRNVCILQPVFDAIKEYNTAYSADIGYDIFCIQDEMQKWDNIEFVGGRFIWAIGVRTYGVDTIEQSMLKEAILPNDYPGGIFVFRVEYDAERKITYLILDEYEREGKNHAED